ncbi:MAG: C4-type zinc ribbon domain-containing protein [Actinobacteria bacterium]|nr:C4-type zinc ribbon domain-containing protein [Actinomycetota bacterium]
MESLEDLLGVQMLDTRIDQIRHQKKTLPQRQEVIDQTAELGRATVATEECAARLKALRRSQKEAEDHASILEDKATEVNGVLYDGSVSSHKELEALQQEHQQLKQHQGQYEDQALEFMELAEPVEAELELLHVAAQALNESIADLEAQITVALAELDVQLDEQVREREAAQSGIPADLLSLYEGLRAQQGGIAVARLAGARCEGCHLEIPSGELDAIRKAPADQPVTCPECTRLLVR